VKGVNSNLTGETWYFSKADGVPVDGSTTPPTNC